MALTTRTLSAIGAAAIALTVGLSTVAGQTTDERPAAEGRRHGLRPEGRGPGGPGGPGRFMLPLGRLDLTEAQRAQVKEVLQAARPAEGDAPFRQMMELRRSLRAAVLADTPDQAQIDQLRASIGQAEAAALSRRIEVAQKIAQILTPEQREKARTLTPRGGRTH
jgi:Spy/CpxP family protein refolding chaperone